MRKIFFLFLVLLTFSLAQAFPIGVVKPMPACVRPNSTGTMAFESQSMSNSSEYFNVYIKDLDWVTLENNYVLIQPRSEVMVNAMINTNNVSEGYYDGSYEFCYLPVVENATAVVPCIKSDFSVNVSQACQEINKTSVKTSSFADKESNYSYLSMALLVALFVVISIFIVKRFFLKAKK